MFHIDQISCSIQSPNRFLIIMCVCSVKELVQRSQNIRIIADVNYFMTSVDNKKKYVFKRMEEALKSKCSYCLRESREFFSKIQELREILGQPVIISKAALLHYI